MKYYAVKRGHKPGIYDNWTDCQNATKGFSNPDFKSFNTKEEAEAYLIDKDIWKEQVSKDNEEGFLVAFVDGSFDKDLNRYSYGVILILPDNRKESVCGYGSNKKYVISDNIPGEIFGVINALDWALSNGYEKIKIYHDYEGLSKWISEEWKAHTEVSKMYVNLYKAKFQDVIHVQFAKVPGHSNISYNEEADHLAKSALKNRSKSAIKGDNWYSITNFSSEDFQTLADLIIESDENISCYKTNYDNKMIYRFELQSNAVTTTLFKTGQHTLLVQGKNSYLFQIITSAIVELDEKSSIENILGSAYRVSIEAKNINSTYEPIESGLPSDYPETIKRLIKQSIINLKYYIESEDYSQYAFPALRALEGHIKYLIGKAGGTVSKNFNQFNKSTAGGSYIYSASLADYTKKINIETCYNYYKSQRDTLFHFGDIIGNTDSTRIIDSKDEADEIIKKCIDLIETQI